VLPNVGVDGGERIVKQVNVGIAVNGASESDARLTGRENS